MAAPKFKRGGPRGSIKEMGKIAKYAKSSKSSGGNIAKTSTRGGAFAGFKRPMEGTKKGGAKLTGQGRDPASGRKVFKKEFRSGFKAAKAGGLSTSALPGTPQSKALGGYRQRLSALDSGSAIGKPGERSFLRGALHAAGGGKGGG